MKKVLVILGPTATGKTDLALQLAKKYNGELISCDSRQVYKGLDIGTGKEPGKSIEYKVSSIKKSRGFWEIDGIRVWLYDVLDPKFQFTVADYVKQAKATLEDVATKGKLPIIVGGTGLYLQALLYGFSNLSVPLDLQLREELAGLSVGELQKKLKILSPIKWESLNNSDRNNKRRLLRSIEIICMNPYRNTNNKGKGLSDNYNILKVGLTAPRQVLNQRIDLRLSLRISQGLIEEAGILHQKGLDFQRMRALGLEYGALADLLEDKINEAEFFQQLALKIHQYAKRQMTWFKRESDIFWFDIIEPEYLKKVENLTDSWYHSHNE